MRRQAVAYKNSFGSSQVVFVLWTFSWIWEIEERAVSEL